MVHHGVGRPEEGRKGTVRASALIHVPPKKRRELGASATVFLVTGQFPELVLGDGDLRNHSQLLSALGNLMRKKKKKTTKSAKEHKSYLKFAYLHIMEVLFTLGLWVLLVAL